MTTDNFKHDPTTLPTLPLLPTPLCLSTPELIRQLAYDRDVPERDLTLVGEWLGAATNRFVIGANLFSLAVSAGNCRLVRAVWPHLDPEEAAKDAEHAVHTGAVRCDAEMIGTILELAPQTDLNDAVRFAASFTHVGAIDTLLRHARSLPDRQVEKTLIEAALWRACRAVSVDIVTHLIVHLGAECSHAHLVAAISGGSCRLRRSELEVLACRIVDTMLANSELCRADLYNHGPALLARCIEQGHKRIFRMLLGHGARAYEHRTEFLIEAAIAADTAAQNDHFLRLLHEVGARVDDCRSANLSASLTPELSAKCGLWSAQWLSTAQWRVKIAALLETLRVGRIVLQRTDRGDYFGMLTRWLDIELLTALSGGVLSDAEVRRVSRAIDVGAFFASRKDLIEELLGWRALPAAAVKPIVDKKKV